MTDFKIQESWNRIKLKIQRKYRDISDEDLNYTSGNEEALINNLMQLIKKDRNYVVFMLKKMEQNKDNNLL